MDRSQSTAASVSVGSTMVGDILAHHGVKGMKWGVRKDAGHEGEQATTKKIAKLDKKFERGGNSVGGMIDIHNRAAQLTNAHDIDRINNKPEYKNADLRKPSPLRDKYYAEHQAAFIKNLKKAAEEAGTNASGTKKYAITTSNNGSRWHLHVVDVKHADDGEENYDIQVSFDKNGLITGYSMPVMSAMTQSSDILNNILAHHGVLGMKWGHRKGSSGSSSGGSKSSAPTHASGDHIQAESHQATVNKHGLKALSNQDLRKLNERMQLEQTYRELQSKKPNKFDTGHKQVKRILSVAKTINDIHNTVNSPLGKAAKGAVKTAVKGAAKTAESAAE